MAHRMTAVITTPRMNVATAIPIQEDFPRPPSSWADRAAVIELVSVK